MLAGCGRLRFDQRSSDAAADVAEGDNLPSVFTQVALPPGGNAFSIARAADGTYYVDVSNNHILTSIDHGVTWTPCGEPTTPNLGAVTVDPANGTVYTASDTDVFTSTDGCATWQSTGLAHDAGLSIAVFNNGDVLSGGKSGLWRRHGGTWSAVSTPADGFPVTAIAVDVPNDRIFLASAKGIMRSIDGGTTWASANTGLTTSINASMIVLDPTRTTNMFTNTTSDTDSQFYRSIDGGSTWSMTANSGGTSVAIDPASADFVVAYPYDFGINTSTDAGADFSAVDRRSTTMYGAPVNALFVDPSTSEVFAATGRGVFTAPDHLLAWTESDTGIMGWSIRSIVVGPTGEIDLATTAGVLHSVDGGTTWTDQNNGFAYASDLHAIVRTDATTVVTGGAAISSSADGGVTYNQLYLAPYNDGYVIDVLRVANGRLVAGTARTVVTSDTALQTFTQHPIAGGTYPVRDLQVLDAATMQIVVATDGGVWYTTDGGGNFASIGLATDQVYALEVLPDHSLLAGSSAGVFRSTAPGSPWTASGLAGVEVDDLLVTSTSVIAATTAGVFISTDDAVTWTVLPGLDHHYPTSLAVDSTGHLLVGTNGFGLFSTPL